MNKDKMVHQLSLQLLGQACMGTLAGALISMLIASLLFDIGGKPNHCDYILSNFTTIVLSEPREKAFYLLSLLFGFAGGYSASKHIWHIRSLLLFSCLAASIPAFFFLAREVLQHNKHYILLTFMMLIVVIPIHKANRETPSSNILSITASQYCFSWTPWFIFLGLITLLLLPESFTELAAHISMRLERAMHVVSFIIAPALYTYKQHLIPGIDYFTQYSLGMGWIFAFILGTNAVETMTHYTWVIVTGIWLFYAQIAALLYWLYRSWFSTYLISLLSLILLFHTADHFFDPSSSVLRYPLLGVCAWLLSIWIRNPQSRLGFLSLALGIAASIFLNTETGIITGLSVAIATLLTSPSPLLQIPRLIKLAIISLFILISLLTMTFGHQVLTFKFFQAIVIPLYIFGKIGFGGWPISWHMTDYNWFYNAIAPSIALATLALIPQLTKNANTDLRQRLSVLAFFSVAGLLMMAKFINMSIIAVWQVNALGMLIPIGWWITVIGHQVENNPWQKYCTSILFIIAGLWLALFSNDRRNPTDYGLRSWQSYPSLIRHFIKSSSNCKNFTCIPNQPTQSDIELITKRTTAGEQVAIIDFYDWSYLISAKRAPLLLFLPSPVIFTKPQLDESLRRIDTASWLFLTKGDNHQPVINGALKDSLLQTFSSTWKYDDESEHLTAWHRIKAKGKGTIS